MGIIIGSILALVAVAVIVAIANRPVRRTPEHYFKTDDGRRIATENVTDQDIENGGKFITEETVEDPWLGQKEKVKYDKDGLVSEETVQSDCCCGKPRREKIQYRPDSGEGISCAHLAATLSRRKAAAPRPLVK